MPSSSSSPSSTMQQQSPTADPPALISTPTRYTRPLQSPYLRRKQATQLEQSQLRLDFDDHPNIPSTSTSSDTPRRLNARSTRPSLEPPRRLARPSLDSSYASSRLPRATSLDPPTSSLSYTSKRLNRPSLDPAESAASSAVATTASATSSKRLTRPSLEPAGSRPRQRLTRPSLEARGASNTRPSLDARGGMREARNPGGTATTNRPSLEPKSRLARPSLEARSSINNKPANRPSLEPKSRVARPSLEAKSTISRATRPSLDTTTTTASPRVANNRASRARNNNNNNILTPSQMRLEAARKRREANEASQKKYNTTSATTSSTQQRLEAARKRREAAENNKNNEEAKNALMKRRSRLPAAALAPSSRSEGATPRKNLNSSFRASVGRASTTTNITTDDVSRSGDINNINSSTPSSSRRHAVRSTRYGRPVAPDEGATNASSTRTRLVDRGTSEDAPPAPSPRVARHRRPNESPNSRARRAPTIDVPNNNSRRASDVNTSITKSAAKAPRRRSDVHEVPVSRRLDLDLNLAADASANNSNNIANRSVRSKQSRVEAMNAIAASTMGDLNDVNGEVAVVPEDDGESECNTTNTIVVPRTPGKHRGALESFRRTRRASQEARRASLEAEAAAKQEVSRGVSGYNNLEIAKAETVPFGDRAEPGGALGAAWTPKKVEAQMEQLDSGALSSSDSDDDIDNIDIDIDMDKNINSNKGYDRFSRGRISIDKVEALSYSLGTRRRSRAGQDAAGYVEPPNLLLARSRSSRRASCTASPVVLSNNNSNMRSPLGTLNKSSFTNIHNSNGNSNSNNMYKLRTSKSFAFDDDRLSWADMGDDDTDDFLTTNTTTK